MLLSSKTLSMDLNNDFYTILHDITTTIQYIK
jgi:hypothetical protein